MNKRLKKLTAMLLSIVMVFSMVTEAFPAAFAAGEGVSAPADDRNMNFSAGDKTRRPGLYVDFLGDNRLYEAPVEDAEKGTTNERDTTLVSGGVLGNLTAPGLKDQSKETNGYDATNNPNGTMNQWRGYKDPAVAEFGHSGLYDGNTIFWVGVGISKMNLLELFKENNKGVYSAELGFYYDSRYIEPYTGATSNDNAGFLEVIKAANLANYQNYKWDGYSIVDARTDLEPQTDPVTQEVTRRNDNNRTLDMPEIMGKTLPNGETENPWKMTYVSVERTNVDTNRFAGLYDDKKAEEKDLETQYLLIIPFRLKAYDPLWTQRVCLRLTRSAGLLSIGSDDGDTPYAAWERVTTRNPGHELKLMTDFQGDLNIFSGGRYLEEPYQAELLITSAGGSGNTARLTIENDPSPNPVYADKDGEVIGGLYGGTGMRLDVHVETGYKVTVLVYHTSAKSSGKVPAIQYVDVWPNENDGTYTFIMPEDNATVEVIFELDDAQEFWLYLSETEEDAAGNPVDNTVTGIRGNSTVLTATYTETDTTVTPPTTTTTVTIVDKDSPQITTTTLGTLPGEKVHSGAEVRADITVHHDYEAVVSIYSVAEDGNVSPDLSNRPSDSAMEANYVMVLPTGGTIYIDKGMPSSDVVVYVTYRPARKYEAILEVYHKDIDPSPHNVAQLATTAYTKEDTPQAAYSGVVYQYDNATLSDQTDDNHRAVEDPFRILDRVDASSAANSGSLGGDGRSPMAWDGTEDSLMALLNKAATAADLNTIKPLDLRWETTPGSSSNCQPVEGLRKNAIGERYTDSDIGDFYDRLMEIKALADAAIAAPSYTPGTDPVVNVLTGTITPTGGTATTYSYYDLTEEQIQAYILDYELHEQYTAEKARYDLEKAQYDSDKVRYDQYVADKAAAEALGQKYEGQAVREPKLPMVPISVPAPELLSKADAQTRIDNHTWYAPSATTDPATRPSDAELADEGYRLEIRPGRKVAVVLEAESIYTVASGIKIKDNTKDALGNPAPTHADIVLDVTKDSNGDFLLTRNPDYQNEFLFDMPDYDCIVEVTYTRRATHDLKLEINGNYEHSTPSVSGNTVRVTGYGPNPTPGSITAGAISGSITTTPPSLNQDGDQAEVLEDSLVTVRVRRIKGYSARAVVTYEDGSSTVTVITNPQNTSLLREDDMFTFKMPAGNTTITITYAEDQEELEAHLRFKTEGTASDSGNGGYWRVNTQVDTRALEGAILEADITVQPGYYIYAVETYTTSGKMAATNPVVLSGNGWNNGRGGAVTATTTMPGAEYWLWVYFKKGEPEPDPEPGEILRLQVEDPDNDGATKADNWAQVTTPVTIGPLGLGATGGGTVTDSDYARAGDLVRVDFHPAAGYFVESVEVKHAGLGVSVTRISATTAEFTMPAGSATVVVTFRKETDDVKSQGLYLHLAKTERGGPPTGINTIPSFTSPTILPLGLSGNVYTVSSLPSTVPTGTGNTGAAKAGEWVEVNVDVAAGWYIESITASSDGGRIPYVLYQTYDRSNPGAAVVYDPTIHYSATSVTKAVISFIMPSSDAHITVNYRKGPEDGSTPTPDPHEHEVELLVVDPENVDTPYADNKASAVVSGVDPNRNMGPVGKAQSAIRTATSARAGEEVTIEYVVADGYALEIILVTPSGLLVSVNYLDGNHARFVMPDSSVTAIVRFKKQPAIQYTANLVLHFPDGTTYAMYDTIGEGSFVTNIGGIQYDLTNKLYSKVATPGERLDFDLFAHDGYYISDVTVDPAILGIPADYTGAFGHQSGYVMMPAANIQINVYFAEGWPDDIIPEAVPYDLTLKVYDATGLGSTANFVSIAGTALTAPNTDPVGSGQSLTVTPRQAHDEDRVVVDLNPALGCYAKTITVTDSRGKNVPWQYSPGGIAFEMTPAHVTVTVKYAKLPDQNDPEYQELEAKLHLGSTNGVAVTYGDVSAMGSVVLTGPDWPTDTTHQTAVNNGSFKVIVPPQGQTLTLEVTPNTGYHVTAAYAVKRETGAILPLVTASGDVTTSMPQVPGGGTVTFAMPDGNADVYVIFADDTLVPGPDPDRGDLTATLIVAGPSGSGSAVMGGTIDAVSPAVTVTTRNVDASGADSLYAPQETELVVDLTVNPGFGIAAIRVTDSYGDKIPYTWTDGTQRQFTLTMPAGGARVYVELEKITPRPGPDDPEPDPDSQLTAQVVVNNGGGSGNTAVLRYGDKAPDGTIPAGTMVGTLLTPVYAGDGIWVDITVQTGYQIEYLKVVPAKYGIAPSLTDLPVLSQSTSFVMPGEDVVVYVKFKRDDRVRHTVRLEAKGVEDNNTPIENQATITTVYSGTQGPVHPSTAPNVTTAQAAPATPPLPAEWVTVDYTWADGYYITSMTVVDALGNPVPFTQDIHDNINRKGKITFPMVDYDVTVTITWGTDPVKYPAVLHVIDLDDPAASNNSWGKLTWNTDTTGEIKSHTVGSTGQAGVETLMVPAGETVQVDADAEPGTFIQSAFVLYRVDGQMIMFNFKDPIGATSSGHKTDTFIMHPCRPDTQVDVYIYYTKIKPNPKDHSAVLMLDSPASDTTSTADIERTRVPGPEDNLGKKKDSVTANDPTKTHGYVTASDGDTITVTVNPASGYTIDYVLMTPLGTSSDQGGPVVITRTGDTYTFTMPDQNVAVYVKLKEDSTKKYKATLHYQLVEMQDDGSYIIKDLDPTKNDWAQLSFTSSGVTTTWNQDKEWKMVPEGVTVEVGASITGTDYVLAAYVLEEDGSMVPLTKALEGLTETNTPPDHSKLDDISDFTMPGADVHVFVWFVNEKPAENWRTAVLTVFDSDSTNPANNNSGLNSATLESSINNKTPIEVWSTGVTGRPDMPDKLAHQFIWVTEGETVTVKSKHIEAGYSFVDATISHSKDPVTSDFTQTSYVRDYEFQYTVGDYNSAVVVRYEKSELTWNPLNVVLIDRDNPGDGMVKNSVSVTPQSMTTLVVDSWTSAGARQRIPSIQSGTVINYTVDPATGYTFVARLKDSSGQDVTPTTWSAGQINNAFSMLNEETTLEITYFKGRRVTLSVQDTRGTMAAPNISAAQMTEDAFGGMIVADSAGVTGVFTALPSGTVLTASMTTLAPSTKLIGVLLIDSTGTRWLAANAASPNDYVYTLANRDVEIRMIVGPENENNYLATVSAVNLPAGTAAPTIAVTNPGANPASGPDWTVAEPGNEVTVTVDVPYGYKAVLTTDDGVTLSPGIFDGTITAVSGGTVSFTMPAKNVHVTVTYVKTRFTATIQTAGSGTGTADLTYDTTTVYAGGTPDTIYDLLGGETLSYTAAPDVGSTLTRVLMTTDGGTTQLLTTGSFTMPADDVTVTVFFDKDDDNDRHHIAFVTVVDPDHDPDNAAQSIQNTTQSLGGGILWTYGDENDGMKVMFTVAPGYSAVVTAEYADGSSTSVLVTQQGGNNLSGAAVMNATATLAMPDADVKVTITYSKNEPESHVLKLRLVGHGQEKDNQATLYASGYGSMPNLHLQGDDPSATDPLWTPGSLTVTPGTALDLDAGRKSNYIIVRATIGLLDPNDLTGTTLLPGSEVDLVLNEYGTTATNLHYMPSADAVVTVYYRLPYKATLFVVDAAGDDYNNGMATPGPADTTATPHDRTPDVTMDVVKTDGALAGSTTLTHTPIGGLDGTETVVTTVDKKVVAAGGTMPDGDEIASVIATTASGTVHLLEDPAASTMDSGAYRYTMSALPGRMADDVDITVILRKVDAPKMYTATVYKVGHDDNPGNTATITNPTTTGLPNGTIWTGALENDVPVVTVTTASGYYAIVTAVQTGTTTDVPVLQWTAVGPFDAIFTMPAHDVDVTVEYVKEKPKADMTLTLEDHAGKAGNEGSLYNDPTATPDLTVTGLSPFLSADGSEAVVAPVPPVTEPTITNPFSKTTTTKVDVGDYLALDPDHETGYYIKSITFKAAGFTFDMLGDPTFVPRVPVSGGEVIIEFAPGKQSGRPYDPEHSERYNGVGVWPDGNYITGDTADGNTNPDLTVAPMEEQQGWILAESADATQMTVVVTVPTLYDQEKDVIVDGVDDRGLAALADAGVDPAPADGGWVDIPPYYQFYWWDEDNSEFKQFTADELSILKGEPLPYANNSKGDYPKGTDPQVQHYGYRLTLKALGDPDTNSLAKYIQDGGEIYVTATRPGYVDPTADPQVPWVESEMTQVIINSDNVLKPYDPDNEDNPNYEDHWITSENRGDYLLVTVPMLNNKAGDNPTEVDGDIHRLQLHLQVDGTDRNSDIVNVTELLNIVNVREYEHFWNVNLEYDPDWRTNGTHEHVSYLYDHTYENEIYYPDPNGDEDLYHGARFVVEIKSDDEIDADDSITDKATAKANAAILREIFDNDGTMGTNEYRMYITSDEVTDDTDPLPNFRFDDYTDFEVPRYYSLAGELISWAPTHIAELTLYRQDGVDYELAPWLMLRSGLCESMIAPGDFDPAIYNDRWSMDFAFKSSKLADSTAVLTYKMVVQKTSHITYTRTEIELGTTYMAPLYSSVNLVFSFQEPVALFAGDIAPLLPGPNQIINGQDRDLLAGFVYDLYLWTTVTDPAATGWEDSVFNPDSYAYAADLDGNGRITEADMAVLMSDYNFHRRTRDYGDPTGLSCPGALITMLALEELEAVAEETDQAAEGDPTEDPEELPDRTESPELEPEEIPDPAEAPELEPEEGTDQPDIEPDPEEALDPTEAPEPVSGEDSDQSDPETEEPSDPTDPPEPIESEEADSQEQDPNWLTESREEPPASDGDTGPDENAVNDSAPMPEDSFTEPLEG